LSILLRKIIDKLIFSVRVATTRFPREGVAGIRSTGEDEEVPGVGKKALLIQGIATSIDALSAGFTIADYD